MRILVIEDDQLTAQALMSVLAEHNYAVEVAADGQAGWELAEAFTYDLILLDVVLPKLDGISLCRRLRSQGHQMPILLLTGRDSGHDKAIGLDAGADDYVVKPFDAEELVARVRALLRRAGSITQPILTWGELRLDPSTCEVTYANRLLTLTPKEYALLELLMRNHRRVFSCTLILDHLWSYEETPGEEAVRTHVKGLRQKLKSAGAPTDLIETVYGIGYRLKPLEAMHQGPAMKPSDQIRQQTLAAIAGVWLQFKDRVAEQVSVLERTAICLNQNTLELQLRQQAEQEAHSLAGSLGTFGLDTGSRTARQIEQLLRTEKPLGSKEIQRFDRLVAALRQSIDQAPMSQPAASEPSPLSLPLVLVVDNDRSLAEQLSAEAGHWGLRVVVTPQLEAAKAKLQQQVPHAIVLNLDLTETHDDSLLWLAELNQQRPSVPVIVTTAQDDFQHRLEVARLGGRSFLQKPIAPIQLLDAVTQVLQSSTPTLCGDNVICDRVARIFVVDDDPQILETLRQLLEPWGLEVITLTDPRRFWEMLEVVAPDLLILDIKMPYVSGVELCQVVRNDARWHGLPILFLTAHTSAETINQVFAVGADDFVSKPIIGPELVTRILNRLERIKFLRRMAEIDPLTGVANRHKSTQDLLKLLRLAHRHHQPFCLSVLDLDHFKQVNDHYGHAIGDTVLHQFGQLLRQSFRGDDVVARWGGEEFVVGMYGTTKQDAAQRLTQMLEAFYQQVFQAISSETGSAPRAEFRVTFSAGVAQYPEDGQDLQALYQIADQALYRAKSTGQQQNHHTPLQSHIACAKSL
jgi:diguanylate cyclase (GGDEF)-like protein